MNNASNGLDRTRGRLRGAAAEHWPFALSALALGCAVAPLGFGNGAADHARAVSAVYGEWPSEWQGQPLQPLALSAVEQRFSARFPGRIARFALTDAGSELVLRDVQRPTRMLHPAEDCWRGIGWQVQSARLVREGARAAGSGEGALWRCFEAARDGRRVQVCERIVDAAGLAFTDTSAWFWAAWLGDSRGPWRAITRVEPLL